MVDELRFVIGVEQPNGTFLAEEADGIYAVDRDLTASDFRLLVHDRDVASPTWPGRLGPQHWEPTR